MTNLSALRGALFILFAAAQMLPLAQSRAQTGPSNISPNFGGTGAGFGDGGIGMTNTGGGGLFGTIPFRLIANVRGGYDDNITTSNQYKQGSAFTNAGVVAFYDFGDPRTRLNLQVGSNFTYYYDYIRVPGVISHDYDIETSLRLSLSHKASPRLTLSMEDYIAYESEPDFAIAQGFNRRAGNYFFTQDKFTGTYLWSPRFATATSYTVMALRYDDAVVGSFENRVENTFGNEFRFLLAPNTTLVAEYRFQIVTYEDINRDSRTHFALAGFDHSFDPRLTLSVRGGAEFREYDPSGSDSGPYVEGTLSYLVAKQTSVAWTNRYGIEESDVLISPSRKTFRTGLTARHEFTPRISGSLSAYYEHDDYKAVNQPTAISPSFTEENLDVAVTVKYAFTRYFAAEAGYNHTDVWSEASVREYSRNRYWAGLNVTF